VVKTLLIENSTDTGTVVMARNSKILATREVMKAGMLSAAIHELLGEFGSPTEIVVGLGPGSYTGIRVAVATAIGLQTGLGCPTWGCSSVLAYNQVTYHAVGNARLGTVFLASIEENHLVRPPELHPIEDFILLLPGLCHQKIFAVGPIPGIDHLVIVPPRAEHLLLRRGSFESSLTPIYLREPHTTAQKSQVSRRFR
jgi:tRNA A37 threonylcarbamoyladenosine modification protein TsaB